MTLYPDFMLGGVEVDFITTPEVLGQPWAIGCSLLDTAYSVAEHNVDK